jgi:hypothetical protein
MTSPRKVSLGLLEIVRFCGHTILWVGCLVLLAGAVLLGSADVQPFRYIGF